MSAAKTYEVRETFQPRTEEQLRDSACCEGSLYGTMTGLAILVLSIIGTTYLAMNQNIPEALRVTGGIALIGTGIMVGVYAGFRVGCQKAEIAHRSSDSGELSPEEYTKKQTCSLYGWTIGVVITLVSMVAATYFGIQKIPEELIGMGVTTIVALGLLAGTHFGVKGTCKHHNAWAFRQNPDNSPEHIKATADLKKSTSITYGLLLGASIALISSFFATWVGIQNIPNALKGVGVAAFVGAGLTAGTFVGWKKALAQADQGDDLESRLWESTNLPTGAPAHKRKNSEDLPE